MVPSGSLLFSPATPSLQGRADSIAALLQELETHERRFTEKGGQNTHKAQELREQIRHNKDQLREVLALIQAQEDAMRIQQGPSYRPLGFVSMYQPYYSVPTLPVQASRSPRQFVQATRTLEGYEFMLIRNGQEASEEMHRVRGELARRRAVLAQARGISQPQPSNGPETLTEEESGLPARPAKRPRRRR